MRSLFLPVLSVVLAGCTLPAEGTSDADTEASTMSPTTSGPNPSTSETAPTGPVGPTTTTMSSAGSGDTTTEPSPTTGAASEDSTSGSGATTGPEIQVELGDLRIDMQCMEDPSCPAGLACGMDQTTTDESMLIGAPGEVYTVTVRVRGVVETSEYQNGVPSDPVYIDGDPVSYYNPIGIYVSAPAHVYRLNVGTHKDFTERLDYTFSFPVAHDASVRLEGDTSEDTCGLVNLDESSMPIVVDEIAPFPEAFDGQFVQVDVEDISVRARH